MFTRFFIHRPIFAAVLSIVITLVGGLALFSLPIAQYPDIAPPTVEVSAVYPGANANVVVDTVAAPIEQQVNGVENMMYMVSQCTNDGSYSLTITFSPGTDLNIAQVLVQNRVALAQPILPDLVQRRGVAVKKKASSVLMIVNLFIDESKRKDDDLKTEEAQSLYLSNYATIQIKDELARLSGVGDVSYLGQRDYAMRIWLDPGKMAYRQITASDPVREVTEQNTQVAAGQIGQPPVPKGQVNQIPLVTMGRMETPLQFNSMILKSSKDGTAIVRLSDVGRAELGAQSYDQTCTMDGKATVALSIYQLPGSNALKVAKAVRDKMDALKERFPHGVDYKIVYDTTPFIVESIREVFVTLFEAVVLVVVVVLLFLQNWRSTLIPLVAVPVAVIGTFAVMAGLGFSLNNLTLFGLVLAIGIVVDDAIVVVEAVEHHIEHGMPPREATILAMDQVSGPVVAVGLVLAAVFVPCAFISGIVGQFFRQFALTIAVSTVISAFNSLTLSPALAALLLKPRAKGTYEPMPRIIFVLVGALCGFLLGKTLMAPYLAEELGKLLDNSVPPDLLRSLVGLVIGAATGLILRTSLNFLLAKIFGLFNVFFDFVTRMYTKMVAVILKVSLVVLIFYAGLMVLTYWTFTTTPTGFIPSQDKGYLLVNVQLPDGSSAERTRQVMAEIDAVARKTPGVAHTVAISGQSILLNANAPNFGAMYVMLDKFENRLDHEKSGPALAAQLQKEFQERAPEGLVNVFEAPPIEGLGTAGGFKIMIEDRGDLGLDALQEASEAVVQAGDDTKELQGLFTSFRANTPWLFIDIDRQQAKTLGVSMAEVFTTMQVFFGSLYINDFNLYGRTWQVIAQGAPEFRKAAADLSQIKLRNASGEMVPFTAFAKVVPHKGPVLVMRYNMYPAAAINGNPAPGVSSGTALAATEKILDPQLSMSMKSEWTELALLQLQTGNTALLAFALAVVLVFLVLAAQYESWSLPLAVILVVPMCLLFSVAGVIMAKQDINIFTQVGFVVLVGLACKNAILIVEFAKAQSEAGVPRLQATLEACKLRLRPIIMTSFAFILGVVPLMIGHGAGAEMRFTLGTAVFAGMLGVTLFGIFLTPVFFYTIQWYTDVRKARRKENGIEAAVESSEHLRASRDHLHM